MGRKQLQPGDPTAHKRPITCLFTDDDAAIIERVAVSYSISKAAAVRLMMRAGSAQYDPDQQTPSPPTKDNRNDNRTGL